MIGFIRNKPLPARRYLVLLVLPVCLMFLLTVTVLWPCLANFRTTVKTLRDVRLPAILDAQRTRTNLSMLRKQLDIIYLAEAPLERRRARLHTQALLAGMQESQKTLAQAQAKGQVSQRQQAPRKEKKAWNNSRRELESTRQDVDMRLATYEQTVNNLML